MTPDEIQEVRDIVGPAYVVKQCLAPGTEPFALLVKREGEYADAFEARIIYAGHATYDAKASQWTVNEEILNPAHARRPFAVRVMRTLKAWWRDGYITRCCGKRQHECVCPRPDPMFYDER